MPGERQRFEFSACVTVAAESLHEAIALVHGALPSRLQSDGAPETEHPVEVTVDGETLPVTGAIEPVGFTGFTLGELQLLALGLWVLGEQDRVDRELLIDHSGLCARLLVALQRKVVEVRDAR